MIVGLIRVPWKNLLGSLFSSNSIGVGPVASRPAGSRKNSETGSFS